MAGKIFQMSVFFIGAWCYLQPLYGDLTPEAFSEPMSSFVFEKDKSYSAIIHTSKGKIVCVLYPEKTPITVTNFLQLVEGEFYNGLCFHRVIPNFVIQSGSPNNRGDGDPGYTLPAEIGLKHEIGSLACPRIPDKCNPNRRSNGSQFYITLDKIPFLDGEDTVFGQIVDGFEIIKTIAEGDKIDRIEIEIK